MKKVSCWQGRSTCLEATSETKETPKLWCELLLGPQAEGKVVEGLDIDGKDQ